MGGVLDVSHVEGLIPKEFGADAVEVPGARELLVELEKVKAPWAIVVRSSSPDPPPVAIQLREPVADAYDLSDFRDAASHHRMA